MDINNIMGVHLSDLKKIQLDECLDYSSINRDNRDKLVNSLIPIVLDIASKVNKTTNTKVEYSDLVQSGYLGAIDAVDRYIANKPNNTAKLTTFAYPHLKKWITEYSYNNTSIISYKISSYSEATSIDIKSLGFVDRYENEYELIDDSTKTVEFIDDVVLDEYINNVFSCLSDFEKRVLFQLFGIGVKSKLTVNEISEIENLSVGKIHKTKIKAIEKCREFSKIDSELINNFQNDILYNVSQFNKF